MIRLELVEDILKAPSEADTVFEEWREGLTLADLVPERFGAHLVSLNHRLVPAAEVEKTPVQDGDRVLVAQAPGILEAIFVSATTPVWLSILIAVGDAIIISALAAGLSYGIAALTAPQRPGRTKNDEGSPSRNFQGIQDTAGAGRPIPVILGGPVRCGGHFLQSFERVASPDQAEEGITTLYTQLGICMGPVESITDIQINGNELELLPDVTVHTRLGRTDEGSIPGFQDITHEILYQRPILYTDGAIEFVTHREVEAFEVIFRFPAGLRKIWSNGVVHVKDVDFEVSYQAVGSASPPIKITKRCSSKKASPVKFVQRVEGLALAQYRITVQRLTVDDASLPKGGPNHVSISEVYAIQEITNDDRAHPGIARVALAQVPSSQLNGQVPTTYTFLVKGFNQCRIYTDLSTYSLGWTSNPAWCCAEAITNLQWGWGKYFNWTDHIDLQSFLDWAAYADELVPDGKGGLEKRATFAYVFDQVEPADEQVEVFGEACGVRLVKRGGRWHAIIDRPDEVVWVGGEGNILPGTWNLDPVPQQQRAHRLTAFFQDEEKDFERSDHPDQIPDVPVGQQIVTATRDIRGATRRSQIAREALRLLLHNKLAVEVCEFEANLSAMRVIPGSIFGVNMPTSGIGIASGRILGFDSTGTQIDIDEEVTIEAGKVYELTVHHSANDTISIKRLFSPPGTHSRLAVVADSWNAPLTVGDTYALGEFDSSFMKFRCLYSALTPQWSRKIRGVRYDPQIYSGNLGVLPTPFQSSIPDPRLFPPDVEDLTLGERFEVLQDGTLQNAIDVDWTPPISAILGYYEVWIRPTDATSWVLRGEPSIGHFSIVGDVEVGSVYEISVVPVSQLGAKKAPEFGRRGFIQVVGVTTQPSIPTNLRANIIDGTLVCTVDPLPQSELGPQGGYEWRLGSTWNQSRLLDKSTSPRLEVKSYPRGTITIFVRAFNSVGNKSPQPASTSIELRGQIEENIILSQVESPGWAGTKTGFVIEGGTNKLVLYEPVTSITYNPRSGRYRRGGRWFGFGSPPPKPIVRLEGFYETGIITVSAGSLVIFRPDVAVDFDAIYIGLGTFSQATFAFQDPKAMVPFSGDEADKVRVLVEVSYSTTTTAASAFTSWQELRDRGEVAAKYVKFRLRGVVESDAYSVAVSSMKISLDLPDKEVSGRVNVPSATSVNVTYPNGYFQAVKRLLVSLIGGANGDYFKITAESATGFTVEIRNSSHALTTGDIHYSARGY